MEYANDFLKLRYQQIVESYYFHIPHVWGGMIHVANLSGGPTAKYDAV